MKKIINFWGKDGAVSASAFMAAACIGLPCGDDKCEILMRYVGFSMTEAPPVLKAYDKYFGLVFGEKNIKSENIVLQIKGSLADRYSDSNLLLLGCSDEEISADMGKNTYGRTNAGEIFFSKNDFSQLFNTLPDSDFTLINCGSCCGDFTALISKESSVPVNAERYNVLSGPCTSAVHDVPLQFPDIYDSSTPIPDRVSIFDIPRIIKIMEKAEKIKSHDVFNKNEDFVEKNKKNIDSLNEKYKEIVSDGYNFSGLNPVYSMIRFMDYVSSANSTVSASFINMKTDGSNFLFPDIVSDKIGDDSGRKIDITSFVNALSVREIISNQNSYSDGKIYSFGSSAADKYNFSVFFKKDEIKAVLSFMLMSVMVSGFVRTSFSDKCGIEHIEIIKKWAVRKNNIFNIFSSSGEKLLKSFTENPKNKEFAVKVKNCLNEFIKGYISPVLAVFEEIDSVSEQSCMLSGKTKTVAKSLIKFKLSYISRQETENNIKGIVKNIYPVPDDKLNSALSAFTENYIENFPVCAQWQENDGSAQKYSEEIIKYTMKKSREFAGGI
ncbi:MAG: hypothetical protein IJ666_03440 [Ruminococcus sp.]|nr:hypothetical protein [Ruminococcus sp.]